jgi:succinate dehydrogenase / fumarate reductase cytochrome b subunit
LHILHFKFGTMYETQVDGETMRDLHRTVFEYFAQPLAVLWYVVAMSCVGIHVAHGLQSALQSLGINHPKYNCLFKCGGKLFAAGVAVGFSSLAIYCHLAGGQ